MPWKMRARLAALGLLAALLMPAPVAAHPDSADPVRALTAELRVQRILRRIMIANHEHCDRLSHDHGLVIGAPTLFPGGAPLVAVLPGSPAAAAGLQPGDLVRGVNGTPWSPDPDESAAFQRALDVAGETTALALVIERDHHKLALTLVGQSACRGEARLSATPFINATAMGETVVVEAGLERLLADDAELAFALAHEAAHLILGHTAPDRRGAIGDRPQRLVMEGAADALALRLMARAGYDPAAAPCAWLKIADASRPPLHRLMDLHGPYMGTAERAAFLSREAARIARGEAGPWRRPMPSR